MSSVGFPLDWDGARCSYLIIRFKSGGALSGRLLGLSLSHYYGLELPCLVGDVDVYILGLGHELHRVLLDKKVEDDHARVTKDIKNDNDNYYTRECHKLFCKGL